MLDSLAKSQRVTLLLISSGVCKHFGGGLEVHFGQGSQSVAPAAFCDLLSGLLDRGRDAAGKGNPNALSSGIEPVNEFFAGENGSSGDGVVRFGLGSLVEYRCCGPSPSGLAEARERQQICRKGRADIPGGARKDSR